MRPRDALESSPRASRHLLLFAVGFLAIALWMSPASRASLAPPPPSPLIAPVIQACSFIPDPRTNTSYGCLDSSAPSAFVNVSVFFQVNVSDSTDNNMNVTFSFDYLILNGSQIEVNPASPNRTIAVSSPGGGLPVSVNTTWTYTTPNANFGGRYFVNISVRNDAGEFDQNSTVGWYLFPVLVSVNSPPFMDGLLSLNSVTQAIRPQNPIIPLVYENVTVGDPDNDPVTLTWYWGDGTRTVNTTDTSSGSVPLSVTHQYLASFFPLNQTPRYVDIPVVVWIDDGLGHNSSLNSTMEFYLDFDSPPNVRIDTPTVGSVWKVGDTIAMVGNVTDPEGSPITAYWDFDNRTDSTNIGDPTRNQDASGPTATHTYSAPGTYNITLWATDGNKELCFSATCSNFTTHWRSAVQPIDVRANLPPVLALSNASAIAGHTLQIRASVYDPNGDNMTVRWIYGDGTNDTVNHTGNSSRSAPQVFEVFQDHNYTTAGNYTLTLSVTDGTEIVNDSVTILVQSFNLPPVLLNLLVFRENGTASANNSFTVNSTVVVRVLTYDPENDTLNLSIDWADGNTGNLTIDPKNRTAPCALDNLSRNICTLSFSHLYGNIGSDSQRNYTIIVTVTDNQVYFRENSTGGPPITLDHVKQQGVLIVITNFRTEGFGPWDWWDYSTLALVLGIPAVLITRFAWKVRREREEA